MNKLPYVLLLMLILGLNSCGQKGPLYLPKKEAAPKSNASVPGNQKE